MVSLPIGTHVAAEVATQSKGNMWESFKLKQATEMAERNNGMDKSTWTPAAIERYEDRIDSIIKRTQPGILSFLINKASV